MDVPFAAGNERRVLMTELVFDRRQGADGGDDEGAEKMWSGEFHRGKWVNESRAYADVPVARKEEKRVAESG